MRTSTGSIVQWGKKECMKGGKVSGKDVVEEMSSRECMSVRVL